MALDEDSFNKLLQALDEDREKAAAMYKNIHQKLITFFRSHGCASAEDCADLTMDRVARKISDGLILSKSNPHGFFFGVARNILHEYRAQQAKKLPDFDDNLPVIHNSRKSDKNGQSAEEDLIEKKMECLDRCLNGLTAQNRQLIVEYYQGEMRIKIKNRNKLSEQLGIPINTLRIRALRLRQRLKDCVSNCLNQPLEA